MQQIKLPKGFTKLNGYVLPFVPFLGRAGAPAVERQTTDLIEHQSDQAGLETLRPRPTRLLDFDRSADIIRLASAGTGIRAFR